jgi:hypothetical protein
MTPGRGGKRLVSRSIFFVWVALLFVTSTSLTAAHLFTLPKPDVSDRVTKHALDSLRSSSERDSWLAVHVMYAQCRCSRRILEHLASSPRPHGAREKLLLVGSREDLAPTLERIAARGIALHPTTAEDLRDRFHVASAPLLLVLSPAGTISYSGGYTEHKQGPKPRDAQIIAQLMQAQEPVVLPLFGCAVSKELQALLDPIGLRALL